MLTPADEKINKQPSEYVEIMLFLRKYILSHNKHMTESFKYMTICYDYKGKLICFIHAKGDYVYLCFKDGRQLKAHPKLLAEGRKTYKAFKCFINKNIDVKSLNEILKDACEIIDEKLMH